MKRFTCPHCHSTALAASIPTEFYLKTSEDGVVGYDDEDIHHDHTVRCADCAWVGPVSQLEPRYFYKAEVFFSLDHEPVEWTAALLKRVNPADFKVVAV